MSTALTLLNISLIVSRSLYTGIITDSFKIPSPFVGYLLL